MDYVAAVDRTEEVARAVTEVVMLPKDCFVLAGGVRRKRRWSVSDLRARVALLTMLTWWKGGPALRVSAQQRWRMRPPQHCECVVRSRPGCGLTE